MCYPIIMKWLLLFLTILLQLNLVNILKAETPKVQIIEFEVSELPPSLFNLFTGKNTLPYLQYVLPGDYSPDKSYPLLLYIPGFHGHAGGNIKVPQEIAGSHECVVATLPLFKESVDREEVARGLIVSLVDYPTLSEAYNKMLSRLFEEVPNIDKQRSAMVGFSNGAITIAVLVSNHDPFILTNFHSFCMVDHGMFHLMDLHKKHSRDKRYLIMTGDQPEMGRELKLRAAQLLEDSYQLLQIDVESRVLKDTGHELTWSVKQDIGEWVFKETTLVESAN